MSTRSAIAVLMPDGLYTAIYCHSDGYPSNNGRILAEHYNTQEKVEALVKLGALSVLDKELTPPGGKHPSFDDRERGYTLAYHRDRGDDYWIARGKTADRAAKNIDHAYLYTFANGEWTVSSGEYDHLPISQFCDRHGDWDDIPCSRSDLRD